MFGFEKGINSSERQNCFIKLKVSKSNVTIVSIQFVFDAIVSQTANDWFIAFGAQNIEKVYAIPNSNSLKDNAALLIMRRATKRLQ